MDELVAAYRNCDMGRARSARVEEQQIPCADAVVLDVAADPVLLDDRAGHIHTVLREDVLDQPAAIETAGIRPAVPVRNPLERQGGTRQRDTLGLRGGTARFENGRGTGGRRERLRNRPRRGTAGSGERYKGSGQAAHGWVLGTDPECKP